VCWQEREDVDNGVCGSCSATLGKRVTSLAIENARLREAAWALSDAVIDELRKSGPVVNAMGRPLWQAVERFQEAMPPREESDGSPG
jgi:hypothetical protein